MTSSQVSRGVNLSEFFEFSFCLLVAVEASYLLCVCFGRRRCLPFVLVDFRGSVHAHLSRVIRAAQSCLVSTVEVARAARKHLCKNKTVTSRTTAATGLWINGARRRRSGQRSDSGPDRDHGPERPHPRVRCVASLASLRSQTTRLVGLGHLAGRAARWLSGSKSSFGSSDQ